MISADVHDLARNAPKVIVVAHRGIVSEPGSVAEQVAQGDLALGVLLKGAVDGKIRQVGSDGGVEVEKSLLNRDHDRRGGERLGGRLDAEDRVHRDRGLAVVVGVAKALSP